MSTMVGDPSRAVQSFEDSVQLDGNMYALCLPWLTDGTQLPNNYHRAVIRLRQTGRSLMRNSHKAYQYERGMKEYLEEEFVEEVCSILMNFIKYKLPK
ncbi:hypothetical protein T07_14607 [Trichinella nelsoni]|uniref:Uncharacterized protein n=1 Tax=Trichinella nelsoni TaxID=6336 RepID=A0A0V0RWB1_9BILA|nr:hypothetical protein T07_14607 [Trichinella nelsoni]